LRKLIASALIILLGVITTQPVISAALPEAAAITTDNDQEVPFNRTFRVSPHNVYGEQFFDSLDQALGLGVRVLELDIYGEADSPSVTPCLSLGGFVIANVCFNHQGGLISQMKSSLSQVMSGQPVTNNSALHLMNIRVKHDPLDEDPGTGAVGSFLKLIGLGSKIEAYGNNCDDVTALIGNMKTQLGNCLKTVKTWMDNNPRHTPIILYLDVKRDPTIWQSLALDITLRKTFGAKLYTPADLKRFPADTPRAAALAGGWKNMEQMRDKVIAIYTGGETFQADGGAINNNTPNDTLRLYINQITGQGFEPAAFVCPRASMPSDVDTPYGFGRNVKSGNPATLMSYVTCVNSYTGGYAWKQQTHSVTFERAMEIVSAASSRNMLSYVWSYEDGLAVHQSVVHEFVRRGVTWFDTNHFKRYEFGKSPLLVTQRLNLSLEGVGGITNYGIFIRQRNNPTYVLSKIGNTVGLAPFQGSKAQQWVIDDWGRIRSGESPSLCIGAWTTRVANHQKPRPNSNYATQFSVNEVVQPDPIEPWDPAPTPSVQPQTQRVVNGAILEMVNCDDAHKARSFELVPADPKKKFAGDTGFLFRLTATDQEVYITPSDVNGTAVVALNKRNHARYALTPDASQPDQGGGANGQVVPVNRPYIGPLNPRNIQPNFVASAASIYVYLQEFELDFDKQRSEPITSLGWVPTRAALGGQPESPPINFNATWRDFPIPSYTEPAGLAFIQPLQRGLWRWANSLYYSTVPEWNGNKVLTRSLPYGAIYPTYHTRYNSEGVTSQLAASEFMSELEYSKWLSAVETEASDVPKDTREDIGYFAGGVLAGPEYQIWWDSFAYNNPPVVPGSVCCDYLDIRNHGELWYIASSLLSADDYKLWQQRRDITADMIPLNESLTYIAKALLEREADPNVNTNEYQNWLNASNDCYSDATAYQSLECRDRFLPEANQGSLTWKDIPMNSAYITFARAAFGLADVDFATACDIEFGPQCNPEYRSAHWAKWNRGTTLRTSLGDRELTFIDVPVTADYAEIAEGLLSTDEYTRYQEYARIQNTLVANGQPVTHLSIDPEDVQRAVAAHYLAEVEFKLWEERTLVEMADFPLNTAVLASKGNILLSSSEKATVAAALAQPGVVEVPAPTHWHHVPPGKGKRFAAQNLLPYAEYVKWLEVAAADQLDFPQVWSNSQVVSIATSALTGDEYQLLAQKVGATPPVVNNLNWLMMPRRASAHQLALRLLPNSEAQKWVDMMPLTLLPQHLGRSKTNANYAKSVLTTEQFAQWNGYADNTAAPNDWRQFTYDTSLIQERVVEAVFGTNSDNHKAWRTAAGRPAS
jgi:Phosphoinositide phospholipase C, Ca2+-dependent